MKKFSKTTVMMLLEKIAGNIGKQKLGIIAFIF